MSRWVQIALAVIREEQVARAPVVSVDTVGTVETPLDDRERGVATFTTISAAENATEFENRAAIIEIEGGIPREWAEGLARLISSPPPAGVFSPLWRSRMDRAARFCDAWAAKAAACGWSAADLFGLNPAAPLARYDGMGAAFLGIAGEVVEVTPDTVVIQLPNGVRQSVTKRPDPQPPAWTWTA